MYKVIKFFIDLEDNHPYDVGDTFPRKGMSVMPSRLRELSGSDNRQGVPLIEEVAEPKKSKTVEKTDDE